MGELRINGVSYSGSGSDTKVTQNSITSSGSALPLLLANSNGTTETAEVNKDNTLTFSPSGNQMQIKADSNSVAPPTIVLRKDSGSNAPEESVQLAHLGSPNGYILRTYNNSTSRGVEAINIADSTQTTKPIITVDNDNALKSDCVVREYVDSRNIQDLANVTITTPAVGDTLTWNGTNWVNGSVTNLAYATKNTDYVDSANSSYIAYVKFGRVVSIAYSFTTIALSNRYSTLFTNLPKPFLSEMQIAGEGVTPLRLGNTGVVENVYTTTGNSFFRGSFTYLTSDA